ncbi:DNA ligase [Gracilariopsis chorda]|uniref:DNA ligase n=1 Tax=Gracilariopsis chorda TaxID=448386 RepID=A0A2V3IRA5_9FLOR|nr:DNA ligase [Gracilariopsis chorda]|eukprot:PXF44257.1 DNA ligase [Gracilariopsis chorda]
MPRYETCAALDDAKAFAIRIEEESSQWPLEVNGIVFKFNDSRAREQAGHTACSPRRAIAYKFAAQSRVTRLDDVVMPVSRGGLITPVAILEPVRIDGAVTFAFQYMSLVVLGECSSLRIPYGEVLIISKKRVPSSGTLPSPVTLALKSENFSKSAIASYSKLSLPFARGSVSNEACSPTH